MALTSRIMDDLPVTTQGESVSARSTGPTPSSDSPSSGSPPRPREPGPAGSLPARLTELRDTVRATRFALPLPSAERAGAVAATMVAQLDDYLLPRLERLDAPLLVVVGGSTGAGKSTLVNSLVRTPISPAGVLRPTTRAPVLVCHPADMSWFSRSNLLPTLTRTSGPGADATAHSGSAGPRKDRPGTGALQVVSAQALVPGLALLDAPDIDSIVDANRQLAGQLLAAADLWLFVTTAARYADAVPWTLLHTARNRGTAVALVLDRVPGGGAVNEIGPHLKQMLEEHRLGEVPLFVLPETRLDSQGLLAEAQIGPLRDWLGRLARDSEARAAVVRQTVGGAIDALTVDVVILAAAAEDQVAAAGTLGEAVHQAYRAATESVEKGIHDGALLRGEVLARWQELVGTGDIMRALQARVGKVRDRVVAAITGRPAPGERFQEALGSGLAVLLKAAATDAAERAGTAWRAHPAGAALLDAAPELVRPSDDLDERVGRLTRDWQRAVLELVRTEAGDKRVMARASAYAVNATGLLVMVSVFAATAFIPTGAEIAVAGGTTIAAQKVLEAIFGDQAVRALAERARQDLGERVAELFATESDRFRAALTGAGVDEELSPRLRALSAEIHQARPEVDRTP
ncbi:dynamin family protein [Dactylosporangium matsuzakiense]|uniref:ABC transporter n=1 Tax=Dactylosporangium matsuzakiense TaxID=53360 RepID=A0A9W6KEG6_9ACTN|nr:ABC transporter [Dactylosporangium matsuzakiense]